MKKEYVTPEVEVIIISNNDVITTSILFGSRNLPGYDDDNNLLS